MRERVYSSISYLYTLALSQTARSTYLTTFGAGVNAFLGFIFTIVVARSISPADFGLFSVVLNLITILIVFCDLGLSSSILRYLPQAIREGKKEKSQRIIKTSLLATILISGILALLLFLFSSPVAELIFAKRELALPLMIIPVALIGLSLSYLFVSVLQGQQKFLFGVLTESSVSFTKVIFTLFLLVLGQLNLVSVLIVLSVTSFTGFILSFFFVGSHYFSAKTDFALFKTLFSFGVWVALARVANSISSKIDTLMLVRFVETAQVGFYAAAQKMTFIFPVLITGVTAVLRPKFASLKTNAEASSFMKKSALLISLLFIPMVVLFILAPWLTVWIYGLVYEPSVRIFRWLLLSSFLFVANSIPMVPILFYFGRPRFFTIISGLQLVLIFLVNLILIPKLGVIGPAVSLALAYGVTFVISLAFVCKNLRK